MALSFIFDSSKGETPESVARKRALAAAIMGQIGNRPARNVGEGIGNALASIGNGISANVLNRRADNASEAGQESAAAAWNPLLASLGGQGLPTAPRASGASGGGPADDTPANWENIKAGIFKGESGGDYDALFGFSNRPGKQFGNTKLTDMTVDQALAFANPSGPYGQFVKGQVGRVATPMGAYQVVGSTLRAAKNGLGLTGNEQMTPELQDRIGQWVLANQGTGAWAGYRGPSAAAPASQAAEAMAAGQPVQTASLDPSIGMAQASPVPMQPGPLAGDPAHSGFIQRMTNPQPMTGGAAMPMQGMPQVAQAAPAGNAGATQQGQQSGPSIQMLLQAAANPWLSDSQKAVVQMLLKQKMDEQDPSRALDMEYKRAQIAKLTDPNARDKFGNSVIWGQNEQGDWVAMQPSSGGGLVPAQTPEGIKLSPPGISDLNLGTRYGIRDRNGNIINDVAIDNSGKAADTAEGKAQGEAAASYRSMASKLPGLEKVVGELDKLADEATYTKTGQWVDWFRKETGAQPRDAAVARTKYIAMVDNQILPLLRDTFGAQFTVQEGESLRATLGDPNKTPIEKKQVLEAFIEQKKRDVQALAVQGGVEQPAATQPQTGKRLRFNPDTGELE